MRKKRVISQLAIGDAKFVVISIPHQKRTRGGLTKAELAVLEGVLAGLTDGQIAKQRGVSVRTVSHQVAAILRKLGASSRVELGAKLL